MKSSLKKAIILIFSILMVFSAAFTVLFSNDLKARADQQVLSTSGLFVPSDVELAHSTVLLGSNSLQPGLKLTANKAGNSIALKNNLNGKFSFNFEPVLYENNITLKKFDTVFTDDKGNSFTIRLSYSVDYAYASVIMGDEEMGIYYGGTSWGKPAVNNNTEYTNSVSMFTKIPRDEVKVIFDADTMTVSAGTENSENLVWNLSEKINDGREVKSTINSFNNYSVKFSLVEFQGDSCSVLLRKINDCILDSLILKDTGTPAISARFLQKGIKGEKYILPTVSASDLWDGILDVDYDIFSPNGSKISTNKSEFTPTSTGDYIVKCTTKNNRNVETIKEYVLPVLETVPTLDYALEDSNLSDTETLNVSVGQTLYIPKMHLTGDLFVSGGMTAKVTVKCRGVVVNGFDKVDSGFNYKFINSGLYEFIYDLGNGDTKSYKAKAVQEDTLLVSDLKSAYKINDVVDLRTAKISVKNQEPVDCEILVEYPDGKVYANDLFECNQIGEYTIFAEAKIDGVNYACSTEFSVYKSVEQMFEYNVNDISAYYGKSEFTGKSGFEIDFSGSSQEVKYSNVIDLSKYVNQTKTTFYHEDPANKDKYVTKDGVDGVVEINDNAIPLISISIDPYQYGTAAANNYYVNLTDVNDPTNVLSVCISGFESPHASSVRAKAGEQDYVGFNNDKGTVGTPTLFHGDYGQFYRTGRYGFSVSASFRGYTERASAKESYVKLYYDNEEKQLLANTGAGKNCIVCDFDDPVSYTGKPWKGFSEDKAYLTIKSGVVSVNSCKVNVYEIDGYSFDNENFVYSKDPIITVNKSQVHGVINGQVKVPSVKAVDQFGADVNVISKVYYEVNGNSFDVKVKNGKFDVKSLDANYYILYVATDVYGNSTTKRLNVVVHDGADQMSVLLGGIANEYTQGQAGAKISLIPFTTINVQNEVGDLEYAWSVEGPSEVQQEKDGFIAVKAGTYTVKFSITDELGRVGYASYEVVVETPANPVAVSAPTYYGFVRGNVYDLVEVFAVDYNIGTEAVKADVYVNGVKNTTGEYCADDLVEEETATEKVETVKIEYKIGDTLVYYNGKPLSFDVPIKTVYKNTYVELLDRNVKNFLLERYFVLKDGMVVDTDNTAAVAFETSSASGATAQFVQPLSAMGFNFTFDINDVKKANLSPIERTLSYVKIYVTDYVDSAKQITVEFVYDSTNKVTKVNVNGIESAVSSSLSGLFDGTLASAISLTYDVNSSSILESNKGLQIAKLSTYNNGREFEGFSDKVYLSFEIGAENGKTAGIQIGAINGQAFPKTGVTDDVYAPQVVLNGICGGMFTVGEKATIPSVTVFDVLSDVKEATVTVTRNGEVVKDVDGNALSNVSAYKEYVIELAYSGNYLVKYSATDARKGVLTAREYVFTVRVNEKPVISDVEIEDTVKLGKKIEIPIPEVTFAEDNAENIFYIVYVTPDNTYQWFVEGGELIATMKGTYRIRYMAIDAYGNTAYKEYKVECK